MIEYFDSRLNHLRELSDTSAQQRQNWFKDTNVKFKNIKLRSNNEE